MSQLLSDSGKTMMKQKGKDKIGKDISEEFDIEHAISALGDECLNLAVLSHDYDCTQEHENNRNKSYRNDDYLKTLSFFNTFE